jgi:hypothetical protein
MTVKQKTRFVRSRERDDSLWPMALFIHFLPFTMSKMLLVCSKEIDDSGGTQAQESIFGLFGV